MSHRFGLDYTGRLTAAQHRAVGSSFAMRYLSGGSSKDLGPLEARTLLSGGVDTAVVWETGGQEALQGRDRGIADARAALQEASRLGKPASRPIYFAVDFDEAAWQAGAVKAYFEGVNAILGSSRTGVYGGFYVVNRLAETGLVDYFWQTYAWSGGQVSPHANLLHFSNGHVVGGVGVDYNRSLKDDFGQWGYHGGAPKPQPKPPAKAKGVWRAGLALDMDHRRVEVRPMPGVNVERSADPKDVLKLVVEVNRHTGQWSARKV